MKKYFVILSQGEYSDYSPIYYMGDVKITKKEMDFEGKKIGDSLIDAPETGEEVYRPRFDKWFPLMEEWILGKGYERLPDDIPEINVCYSDIPTNFAME